MVENKTAKQIICETGLYSILGGFALNVFFPTVLSSILIYYGSWTIAYYIITISKFDRIWKSLKLGVGCAYPICDGKKRTDNSTIYTFTLPCGLSVEDFDKNKLAIEQHLGREIEIRYTYKAIQIEVFDQNLKTLYEYEYKDYKGKLEIPIGYTRNGELIACDLSSGEPHMLIAGETGSGKSTVLRSIITSLILSQKVDLHLIDLKRGAEFQIFANCNRVKSFCRTRTEAERTLYDISAEIDRRYDLFYDANVVDIKEYNKATKSKLGYEVVIIDEFADLQNEKKSIGTLEEISAKARACGIHLILSTQRPDNKVLNGRIKANVTTILGLKTTNDINSRIIIDQNGLEKLRGSGHGIFKRGRSAEIQCPYLDTKRARELLRHTYIEKKKIIPVELVGDLIC